MKNKLLISGILVGSLCLALTGCGEEKEIVTQNDEDLTYVIEDTSFTNEVNDVDQNSSDIIELYSDDSKLVYRSTDNTDLVFYHEGEKITGYETYITYEDSAAATLALNLLDKEDESIKNAYTRGKYLIVEYDESVYKDLTASAVRFAYGALRELKKDN